MRMLVKILVVICCYSIKIEKTFLSSAIRVWGMIGSQKSKFWAGMAESNFMERIYREKNYHDGMHCSFGTHADRFFAGANPAPLAGHTHQRLTIKIPKCCPASCPSAVRLCPAALLPYPSKSSANWPALSSGLGT